MLPSTPQPEMLIHWGRQGLGAEPQDLEVRPKGEDWGWLHGDSLKGLGCDVEGLGPPERQGDTVGGRAAIGASFSTHTLRHCLHELWGRA